MTLEGMPSFVRRENLVDRHDPKSVILKFQRLPEDLIGELDRALNQKSLSFKDCFTPDYLSTLDPNPEKLRTLSSLNGTLLMGRQDKKDARQEVLKEIVNVLNN